jgi:hypothetical protein
MNFAICTSCHIWFLYFGRLTHIHFSKSQIILRLSSFYNKYYNCVKRDLMKYGQLKTINKFRENHTMHLKYQESTLKVKMKILWMTPTKFLQLEQKIYHAISIRGILTLFKIILHFIRTILKNLVKLQLWI